MIKANSAPADPKEKNLSIIIPAYNAEKTLPSTIDSILCRFGSQEILIIDDGSSDGTAPICNEYACKYSNIAVIHTENGGVSRARNIGIENTSCEYIMFVDADDRIIRGSPIDIRSCMNGCDLLFFPFNSLSMGGRLLKSNIYKNAIVPKSEIADLFLRNMSVFCAPWAKIYKRDIIMRRNVRFVEGQKYGEDIVFVLTYIYYVTAGIGFSSEPIYAHYRNPKGASFFENYYDDMNKYILNQLTAFENIYNQTGKRDYEVVKDLARSFYNNCIMYYYLRVPKEEFKKKLSETNEIFASYTDNILNTKKICIKNLVYKLKYEIKKIGYRLKYK